jgi:ABC-type polysaccharide/polyol phosphate export permease
MIDAVWNPLSRRHLGLLRELTVAQTKLRDQSSTLGFLWSFLHPVMLLGVLYLFFQGRVGQNVPHYGAFLLIGIVQFTHFSMSTAGGMRALHRMARLASNMIFPKEVLVFSSILSDAPEFLISMPIVVVIALITGVPASAALLALPLILLMQLILVLWVALLLSTLYVFVRDLDHIYEVALRILFFTTPIIYNLDFLGPTTRKLALLNPLTHLIEFARLIIMEGRLPPLTHLLGFLLVNGLILSVALMVFRRAEPALVERL